MLTGKGTIVEYNFGRDTGPSPALQPFSTEVAYVIIARAGAALVNVAVLVYFKKYRR